MRRVRASVHVEKKVGELLGRGDDVLEELQREEEEREAEDERAGESERGRRRRERERGAARASETQGQGESAEGGEAGEIGI